MMQLKGNPLTGKMEFHQLDEDYDLKNEIARSTYGGMLHDHERNDLYFEAIKAAIAQRKMAGKSTHVLDIGTSTGLLAMMAARCQPDSVTACEVFTPMAKLAEKVTALNALSSIKVVNEASTSMIPGEHLVEKADILVTEIFDTELIGEGVLPTLRHAHKNLLKDDCIVVPSSANVYVQLIESDVALNAHRINMSNGVFKRLQLPSCMQSCHGTSAAFECQVNQLCAHEAVKTLSRETLLQTFSFDRPYYHTDGTKTSVVNRTVDVTADGTVYAVLLWWSLKLFGDDLASLSMKPKWLLKSEEKEVWRDHWMQAVYFIRKPFSCSTGDQVQLQCVFDDYSLWFDASPTPNESCSVVDRPMCSCELHTTWSRERFLLANDTGYQDLQEKLFRNLAENGIKHCVCIGDCSFAPLIAVKAGLEKVTYIDCGQKGADIITKLISLNNMADQVTIVARGNKDMSDIARDLLPGPKIDAVIGDPFFATSLLPWHNLYFWLASYALASTLPQYIALYPGRAELKVVAVELDELWKTRAQVQTINGFDLREFDNLIESALEPDKSERHGDLYDVAPFAMWEYEHTQLSTRETILSFDLSTCSPGDDCVATGNLRMTRSGTCHAVVIWMDFNVPSDTQNITTGFDECSGHFAFHGRQGLFLFKSPCLLVAGNMIEYKAVFQPRTGEMLFNFTY